MKMEVADQQGKSCADDQVIDLLVCTCEKDAKTCAARSSSSSAFGVGGILLLLLGLLLLLCKYRCFFFLFFHIICFVCCCWEWGWHYWLEVFIRDLNVFLKSYLTKQAVTCIQIQKKGWVSVCFETHGGNSRIAQLFAFFHKGHRFVKEKNILIKESDFCSTFYMNLF